MDRIKEAGALSSHLTKVHKVLGALRLAEDGHIARSALAAECRQVLVDLEAWEQVYRTIATPRQREMLRANQDAVVHALATLEDEEGTLTRARAMN